MSDRLEPEERRKRKREWIAAILVGVLFVGLTFAEFRLSKLSSTLPFVNSIFFFGLLNVNLILLLLLVWLVFRNIGKLFLERRRNILGASLKTKLVAAFLAFSVIPTLALFTISALYINSSFDKWFSLKVQNTLQASLEITRTYYRNEDQTAMHFAEHIASGIARRLPAAARLGSHAVSDTVSWPASGDLLPEAPTWMRGFLESQRELLAVHAVEFYTDPFGPRVLASRSYPELSGDRYPRLSLDLLEKGFRGSKLSTIQHVGVGDLIRSIVPVGPERRSGDLGRVMGVVVVSNYIPVSLVNKVDEISSVFEDYQDTNPLKYPMKTLYLVMLVLFTLVILFVAIWIGLYLARQLTVPVERLVQGAQKVGRGDLDVAIEGAGSDEISVLINSFNQMTRDLKDNRSRLTEASADLEKRRLQLEAVLTNVGTGVIVVDRSGEVTTFNRAVAHLLDLGTTEAVGRDYRTIFAGQEAQALRALIERTLVQAPAEARAGEEFPAVLQWTLRKQGVSRSLATVATALVDPDSAQPWGVVIVIDDITHLVKGQREMAWREVARRIAHEIKNPLTPIKLSAQRLQRRLGNYRGKEATLLKECTDTIIKHTDELKEMVNEFSNFARFPEISPEPNHLNQAVSEVVQLYAQAHGAVQFDFRPDGQLPVFEFDRDQIKRVVINLFDNAVAALLLKTGSRRVEIETHWHSELQIAALIVRDNGPGMSDEVLARVFEPYFSTKQGGTGLGLAIAKRIINDHEGFMRVQSAPQGGAQFTIELPTVPRQPRRARLAPEL